jgi:hypothetical protein
VDRSGTAQHIHSTHAQIQSSWKSQSENEKTRIVMRRNSCCEDSKASTNISTITSTHHTPSPGQSSLYVRNSLHRRQIRKRRATTTAEQPAALPATALPAPATTAALLDAAARSTAEQPAALPDTTRPAPALPDTTRPAPALPAPAQPAASRKPAIPASRTAALSEYQPTRIRELPARSLRPRRQQQGRS